MDKSISGSKAIIIIVALIALGGGYMLYSVMNSEDDAPMGMRELTSYIHPQSDKPTCKALTPECGYCPETQIDNKCYVTQGSYEQYQ